MKAIPFTEGIGKGAQHVRILILENEHRHPGGLRRGLDENGNAVDRAYDGAEGLGLAELEPYCVVARSNVVDVFIGYLRRKLGDDREPRLLRAIQNVGNLLKVPA